MNKFISEYLYVIYQIALTTDFLMMLCMQPKRNLIHNTNHWISKK